MIKLLKIASILSLSLSAACAADTGSYSQDLGNSVDEQSERCTRQLGDFDGTTTPPPITIPVGQEEISAQDAIDEVRDSPNDPRAGLLAEYATLIINIDAGADLDSAEVDLLVLAEDLLVQTDNQDDIDPAMADTLVGTITLIGELNRSMSIEVPCRENSGQTVLDAPSSEASNDHQGEAPDVGSVNTSLETSNERQGEAPDVGSVNTDLEASNDRQGEAPDAGDVNTGLEASNNRQGEAPDVGSASPGLSDSWTRGQKSHRWLATQ